MTKDEALKMCLEYIETNAHERKYVRHAIKEALAQPQQEPVAHSVVEPLRPDEYHRRVSVKWVGQPVAGALYTSPPARKPLSDEEYTALAHRIASKYAHRSDLSYVSYTFLPHTLEQFVRAIEAAHGIKENT